MDKNISFQSRIRLVPESTFKKSIKNYCNNVVYPWTVKQTVYAPNAFTEGVYDCTALGINDGEKVMFMHFCPNSPQNFNWAKIEQYIFKNVFTKLNTENLQALILGSKRDNISSPRSTGLFDFLEGVLNKLSIPYSKFKGGDFENHLSYDSVKDEWLIGNKILDIVSDTKVFGSVENAVKRIFNDVKIADVDELTW